MDYKKLYYKLCNYCKTVDINERIKSRNKLDERLCKEYIYTENHHIIPKHSGGTDVHYNLVKMLPEEHFMAHLIRYKAYNDRNDFLSVRFMINGFVNKNYITDIPKKTMNKMIGRFKQEVGEFRKLNSWHTDDGIRRISESRKGTMPVVDSITGDMIGAVPTDHPNVLSGKWIHHTSGRLSVIDLNGNKKYISSVEYQKNKDIYRANVGDVSGMNNPTYSGITDEQIIDYLIELSIKVGVGYLVGWPRFNAFYRKKYNISIPKHLSSFRFNGGGVVELYRIASEKSGLKINKYPRGILNKKIKENINKLLQE
jgi:hypothetical protein